MEEDSNRDYMRHFREMEKQMLKIDLTRGAVMPLSISDWIDLWGEPTDEDLHDITQAYIKQYHIHGEKHIKRLVDMYDNNWIEYLLSYNEYVEEYELCSILKSHLDTYYLELKD